MGLTSSKAANNIVTTKQKTTSLYPETCIVIILTHGAIIVNEDKVKENFRVPDSIKTIKINSVIPTITNIDTESILETSIDTIKANKEILEKVDDDSLLRICTEITEMLKKNPGLTDLTKEIRNNKTSEPYEQNFIHNIDKGFILKDCTGKYIINKTYSINKSTDKSNYKLNDNYDWKINILGVPDIDLMDEINKSEKQIRTHYGDLTITTKDIISFLEKNGVKRVIIFDFSCCSIVNSNYTPAYEPREERLRKRELLSEAIENGQFWGKRHNKSTRKKLIGKKSNRKNK
jgi:hypothetical protein